jgi:RND family efflux transporter MFP subunit
MFRKKRTWIIFIIILGLVGSAYAYYAITGAADAAEDEEPPLQTSTARRGDMTISATAAGAVIPADEVLLSFPIGGVLAELAVNVGDSVQTGDVLARLEDVDAQKAIVNAQLQLAQAAMKTDASATETGISFDDIAIEQARINVDQAQNSLDDLLDWEPDEDEIAVAEANLAAAEANYNAARGQESATSINITVNSINVANFSAAVSSSNSSNSASAQTNLLNAQLALEAASAGPTDDEIEAAQMAVRQAELNLQHALLNRETNALSLAQAQLNLETAEEALGDAVLIAPMDGTIMSVNASVGETAGSGLIVLADLERPILEVYLDESDLNMIGLGYEVEVVFDALPDDLFAGHVIQIDPQLVNQSGVTAVRALVQLDTESFAKPQTLPVGMNATVEVIGGQAENAVLVPVEAVRELSAGQYAVFVVEEGEPVLRLVEVGLMDFTFAEILSGVEPGEIVSTGLVETN